MGINLGEFENGNFLLLLINLCAMSFNEDDGNVIINNRSETS